MIDGDMEARKKFYNDEITYQEYCQLAGEKPEFSDDATYTQMKEGITRKLRLMEQYRGLYQFQVDFAQMLLDDLEKNNV